MFLQKQQTRWGFILKYLVYLLDSKSNAFREFLLSPELYFVGQNQTLILKEKNLPTKAWLSAVGTQGSNNSIKIRRTSNWNTLVPKQLSSFHPSCVWFRKGIKICSISKWSREVFFFCFVLFLSKLIVQVPLKQVCMKLLLRYLMIITEGLIFTGFHVKKGLIHVVLHFLDSHLSLMWHTHI